MSHYDLEKKCLHSGYTPKKGEPCALPIYQSTTFKYDTTDEMGQLIGVAKVLSTINGTSCSWATFANFSISRMTSAGFAIVSANKTLVFGLNAAAISSALASVSTNVQSIPSFFNVTPRRIFLYASSESYERCCSCQNC